MPRLSRQYHHRCHLLFHHDCLSSSLSSKSSTTSLSSSSSPSFNQRPRCRFGVKVLREPLWDPGLLQLLLLIEYSINVFVFADLYFYISVFGFMHWGTPSCSNYGNPLLLVEYRALALLQHALCEYTAMYCIALWEYKCTLWIQWDIIDQAPRLCLIEQTMPNLLLHFTALVRTD